jgi:hypothetical protein
MKKTVSLGILQAIATATAEVAKNMGASDIFLIVCSPTKPGGMFERVAYFDADANKLVPTLAQFIRQRLPEKYQAQLVQIITQPEEPQPADQQNAAAPADHTKWMN